MASGDVYEMTREVIISGNTHVNVFHFLDESGPGATPEQDIIDLWVGNTSLPTGIEPENELLDIQTGYTSAAGVSFTVKRISPTVGFPVISTDFQNWPSAVDTGLPTHNQVQIAIATDRPDASGRGRKYIGGLPQTFVDGNFVGASLQSEINGFLTAVMRVFSAGGAEYAGYVIGVWSRLLLEFNAATALGFASSIGPMDSRREGTGS